AIVGGPGDRRGEPLVGRGRQPPERERVGEQLDQLVAPVLHRHRVPPRRTATNVGTRRRGRKVRGAGPGPSASVQLESRNCPRGWTLARVVRQAARMLCIPRSLLLVLAVTACGTASAEPRPASSQPAPAPAAGPGVKTIIVVRHAEAEHQPGGDPSLPPAGRARALELSRVLGDTQLTSVYTTHYQRNRQTVAPL